MSCRCAAILLLDPGSRNGAARHAVRGTRSYELPINIPAKNTNAPPNMT
jgi:hypothetical protein